MRSHGNLRSHGNFLSAMQLRRNCSAAKLETGRKPTAEWAMAASDVFKAECEWASVSQPYDGPRGSSRLCTAVQSRGKEGTYDDATLVSARWQATGGCQVNQKDLGCGARKEREREA